MLKVLYYDKNLIVCIKPYGVSSELTQGENNMVSLIYDYLLKNNIVINKSDIRVIHRLDNIVSGVMVYSLNKKSASNLCGQIVNHIFQKEYLTLVSGVPNEKNGIMNDLLFKDSNKNKSFVVNRMRKGVKKASLEYNLIESKNINDNMISLVKVKIHTGRTHQIRVQFASRKMPILGDIKYGSKFFDTNICLWSYRITFKSTDTDERLKFLYLPDCNENYWRYFNTSINNL